MTDNECKWKHLDGALIASCMKQWITDYHYGESEEFQKRVAVLTIVKEFKFCPFCGKVIQLSEWM